MLEKRTHILLSTEMWGRLITLAKEMCTSVGELIRSAVERAYFSHERERDQQIAEAYRKVPATRKPQKGIVDYTALTNEGRER